MAARSSQDLACCWRAMARACWKQASASSHGGLGPCRRSSAPLREGCSETALVTRCTVYGRQRVAELGGFLLQVLQLALAEPFVILGGTDVIVGDLIFEHVIDGTGYLMRRRHECLGWPKAPFQPSVEGPKRAVGTDDRLRRHTEGLGGAVAIFHRAALEDLAAGDVIFGARPSQEQKCLSSSHLLISVPISARMVCAREALMPWTATRS